MFKFQMTFGGNTPDELRTNIALYLGTSSAAISDDDDDNAPAANVADGAVDSAGLPWDARIHSSKKSQNKDGTWRLMKGVDKATVDAVIAELRAKLTPPTTRPAPMFTEATSAPVVTAPTTAAIPMPPAATAPAQPPAPTPAPPSQPGAPAVLAPASTIHDMSVTPALVLQYVTRGINERGLDPNYIGQIAAWAEIGALTDLLKPEHSDKVLKVWNELKRAASHWIE